MSLGAKDDRADNRPARMAIYFDFNSSPRRQVILAFNGRLEINEPQEGMVYWPYGDIRRVDSPTGTLRAMCLSAPALARLEVLDVAAASELVVRCPDMDSKLP